MFGCVSCLFFMPLLSSFSPDNSEYILNVKYYTNIQISFFLLQSGVLAGGSELSHNRFGPSISERLHRPGQLSAPAGV